MRRRSLLLAAAGLAMPFSGVLKAATVPGRVAIVIDDVGFSASALDAFLALDLRLNFAVLPCLPGTGDRARDIQAQGGEVLLHQPMEPWQRGLSPGEGAVRVDDSAARIARVTRENLAQLPQAVGVNNHMGSRFTSDRGAMHPILEEIKRAGLFFLDSRTSARSVAFDSAREHRLRAARRDVFLDNQRDPQAIRAQLRRLLRIARLHGFAVGIGHPHRETARALARFRGELSDSGVELTPVSALAASAPAA